MYNVLRRRRARHRSMGEIAFLSNTSLYDIFHNVFGESKQ